MRVLHSWLRKYIDIRISPEQLAEKLGMLGLEIEGIERLGDKYKGFVVGNVLSVSKHPNADKLSVCAVNAGSTTLQIICGAPNVTAGQNVVVGLAGASFPHNQHDPDGKPFVLSSTKIRGVESAGMICSEYELGLGKESGGIMVLDPSAKAGTPFGKYFGLDDIAYDVEITPNRPDWLSHYGIAREIGVAVGKKAALPRVNFKESKTSATTYLKVKVVDKVNCLRFAAKVIRGVKVGPSPRWLQNSLRNVGLRPRNNIVDITNYVMLECGQPLHAFDHALLRGGMIKVQGTTGEGKFRTLDGKEHQVPAGAVMVCDAEREVSLAGIMGGANSEINEATVDIVLEAACWNPVSIRQTRRAIGITTDASQRFERGTDPEGVLFALQRSSQLVHEIAGGEVLKGTIDIISRPIRPKEIVLRTERVNSILGTYLVQHEVAKLLEHLGITPVGKKGKATPFRVPSHRVDLEREIDLIEEVARVYGYDNIEAKSTAAIDFSDPIGREQVSDMMRLQLAGQGFHESVSYVLQDSSTVKLGDNPPVHLLNSETSENAAMRTSLVPGLLSAVASNVSFGTRDLRLFEIGRVYGIDENSPKLVGNIIEEERICFLLTGNRVPRHWSATPAECDFFDIKGEVDDFLAKFVLDKSRFISYSTSNRLADSVVAVEINGSYAGYFGVVKQDVLKSFGIEQSVYVAELRLGALALRTIKQYSALSKYPKVRRDVAFVIDAGTPAETVERIIRENASPLLQSVELFDFYRGENVANDKKSLAYSLDLISSERTLTDAEIDAEMKRIVEAVVHKTGAVLRTT